MQEELELFETLENKLLTKLENRGCTPVTITGYKYLCNSIFSWLKNNGYSYYTRDAGCEFLEDYRNRHGCIQYYFKLRTVIYRLNDIIENDWKNLHTNNGKQFEIPKEFKNLIDQYCNYESNTGHAAGTVKIKQYAASWFLDELGKTNCTSLEQLSPEMITKACAKITNHNLWGEIRLFLRYLTKNGELTKDYSTLIPHYSKPYVIPSVYSIDEIQKIENAIDISTIQGKRDHAMILLASRMGMRSGDIVKLRFEDIKNRTAVNIIQEKTKKTLHLPLIDEVLNAIDNYVSARPHSTFSEIFLNTHAPYNPVTTATIRHALKKYIAAANIENRNRKQGPHSLRSSLASSMVNDDVSYETVRKILGHSSNNAIKHYARIDVEKLRRYCLESPEISGNFKAFLQGKVR